MSRPLLSSRAATRGLLGGHLFFALALAGCGQDPVRVQPPTFDRPASAVFLCARRQAQTEGYTGLAPLSECASDASGVRDTDVLETDTHALLALVTQTARGEVAAVDLRVDRVLDADTFVPGYTFFRVDETPTGIAVDTELPDVFHVASFAAQRLRSYATGAVLGFADGEFTPTDVSVQLADGPVDLVLARAETPTLYAAIPRTGQVAVVRTAPTGALDPGSLVYADLEAAVPAPVSPPESIEPWERICPTPATPTRRPTSRGAPELVPLGDAPQPVRLRVVDERELLVADASLPLIHRFAIEPDGSLTPIAPVVTGVPVRDLAVTPIVPQLFGGESTEAARYLYAVDATDEGSVLVVDYLEGSPTFGAVLPVHVGDGRADRVRLPGPARSVAVVTPGFDDDSVCELDAVSPSTLRGVFVAVGLSTGLVTMVDVLDLDAPCRGGCGEGGPENDVYLFMRRHVARTATRSATPPVALLGGVSLFFEGAPARLDDVGQTPAGTSAPSLGTVTCAPAMTPVFGDSPRVCVVGEPWAARAETWTATFEGPIPNASSFRARVARDLDAGEGRVSLSAPTAALCARGVLGAEDVALSDLGEGDPELGYPGDILVITSDPPSSTASLPECEGFVANDAGERVLGRFAILDAERERVVVADDEALRVFERCYPSLFSFEVYARGVFTVVGSRSGFAHRVVADAAGRCRVDVAGQPIVSSDPSTYRNGRAFVGRDFVNPFVQFRIAPPTGGELASGLDVQLSFTVSEVPPALSIDVGARGSGRVATIIEDITYSPADERLYVVDSNGNGFSKYDLQPLVRLALID